MNIALIAALRSEFKAAKTVLNLHQNRRRSGCKIAEGSTGSIATMCALTGPGAGRAHRAVASIIHEHHPDLVIDTGTCAGIDPRTGIGDVIIGTECLEFDPNIQKTNSKEVVKRVVSAFHYLPSKDAKELLDLAFDQGQKTGIRIFQGIQATGCLLIDSPRLKATLHELYHAAGANWETTAVFEGAAMEGLPVLSIRVVSDLGDEKAFRDFFSNAADCSRRLYRYILDLLECGWFGRFFDIWKRLPRSVFIKNNY